MSSSRARDAVSQDEPPVAVPRAVGRYDLLYPLATGGMATVYLGRARGAAGFGRFVAIKCCHPHLRAQEEFATMFVDEARLAAAIHHPNVVATLDVSEDSAATLYLVMEYVDGFALGDVIRAARDRGERVPPAIAARLLADALAGLHAAHELRDEAGRPRGIVHRDVSPHNVLVGTDGVARIMDFGIAKAESRLTVTREGNIKGKLAYMAPEQHGLGLPDGVAMPGVDRRADLYAAGVVLWETLTGARLFHGESDSETVRLVVRGVPRRPSEVVGPEGGIPAALDAVVLRALERDPARRFATAEQFAEALESCGLPLPSPRAVGAWVNALLAPAIAARRALLAQFHETPSDRPEPTRAGARPTLAPGEGTPSGVVAAGDLELRSVRGLDVAAAPRWRVLARRPAQVAVVALVLLLGLVGAFAALRPRAVTRPAASAATDAVELARRAAARSSAATQPLAPAATAASLSTAASPMSGIGAPAVGSATSPHAGAAAATTRRPPRRGPLPSPAAPHRGRYRPHFL